MNKKEKILIIDTNYGLFNKLKNIEGFIWQHIQPEPANKIIDIIDILINKKYLNESDAVLINLEAGYENTSISELKGIELVYWLRLKHNYTGPIITYGFLSPEQILRLKPEYVVIHAQGNKHLRLPFEINDLKEGIKPANIEADKLLDIYRPYAEKLVNLHKARHERANWWAIKVMWDIDNIRKGEREPYPEYVQEKLKELNNFLIGEIYKNKGLIRIDDIVAAIKAKFEEKQRQIERKKEILRKNRKRRKQFENNKKNTIESLQNDIQENNEYISLLEEEIDNLNNQITELSKYNNNGDYTAEIEEQKKQIKEKQDEIKQIESKNKEIYSEIDKIKRKNYPNAQKYKEELDEEEVNNGTDNIDILTNQIKNIRPTGKNKVLLIDDKAYSGWVKMYKKIFPKIRFNIINVNKFNNNISFDEKITLLKEAIQSEILTNTFDFIILDLRLFPEDEQISGRELSGIQILDFLKTNFIHIPVLITTASNKIWTLNKCMEKGADKYWMKEGFDNFFTIQDSIRNYIELINAYNDFKSNKYQLLNIIRNLIKDISLKENLWWINKEWKNDYLTDNTLYPDKAVTIIPTPETFKVTKVEKEEIINILNEAEQLVRLLINNNLEFDENYLYKHLLLDIGLIIEVFHPMLKEERITTSKVISSRGDKIGSKIYTTRNKLIHNRENNIDIVNRLNDFKNYLLEEDIKYFYNYKNKMDEIEEVFNRKKVEKTKEIIQSSKPKEAKEPEIIKQGKKEQSTTKKSKIQPEIQEEAKLPKNSEEKVTKKSVANSKEKESIFKVFLKWLSKIFNS